MAWRFEPGEDLTHAFRRVAEEEIAKARAGLEARGAERDKAIHEARQSFKRLRALARLARSTLGDEFAAENRRWRDAGRLLAGARDRTVILETYDKVAAGCAAELPAATIAALRKRIDGGAMAMPVSDSEAHVEQVIALLDAARDSAGQLRWPDSAEALSKALGKSQKRLRDQWKRARKHPSAEERHEWRKCVKDQAAQLRLFRRAMPDSMRTLRAQLKTTAEHLGEEHDLWLLSGRLSSASVPPNAKETVDRLLAAIEKRREALRHDAFKLGGTFSSDRPKDFAAAICEAWDRASMRRSKRSRRKKSRSPSSAGGGAATSQGP